MAQRTGGRSYPWPPPRNSLRSDYTSGELDTIVAVVRSGDVDALQELDDDDVVNLTPGPMLDYLYRKSRNDAMDDFLISKGAVPWYDYPPVNGDQSGEARWQILAEFSQRRHVEPEQLQQLLEDARELMLGLSTRGFQTLMENSRTPAMINLFRDAMESEYYRCLLYTSPSPRDGLLSRMPSSA